MQKRKDGQGTYRSPLSDSKTPHLNTEFVRAIDATAIHRRQLEDAPRSRRSLALASAVARRAGEFAKVDVAVCPPFVYLEAVAKTIAGSNVGLGAQNMYHEKQGVFTGEVSSAMLVDLAVSTLFWATASGAIFQETNEAINKKVHAAFAVD